MSSPEPASSRRARAPALALFELFEGEVRARPQRMIARTAAGLSMNAAALLARVRAAAEELRREGIGHGDLVLLEGLGGIPFATAALAVWARDATVLAADAQLAPPEVRELRRQFAPRAVLKASGLGDLTASGLAREPASGGSPHPRQPPAGCAVVKLTSGSTGRPRGIATTAGQLLADARNIAAGMGVTPDDVCIGATPLSHSYGMASVLLQMVEQGSPMLIVPTPLPDLLASALSIEEPAIFPGVPYLFEMLARPGAPAVQRRGLRICLSAAAPLRAATAAAFLDRIGLPVRAFYGTSETGGISYDASPQGLAAVEGEGCVGTPLPGVSVTLEGDESRVVVRGENVACGYLGAPAEGRDADAGGGAFLPGVFRTGDTGRLDALGRLHLTGRCGTLVNVSGRKVNPREIENSLTRVVGVGETFAMGVADGVRGEALAVFIVRRSGAETPTRETVMKHLREELAPFKIPRRVIFVANLPRGPRGKLDHETLRRLASEEDEDA